MEGEILDTEVAGQSNLQFTPLIREYLEEIRKWSKFISIVGFVGIGLMVLAGLGVSVVSSVTQGAFAGASEVPVPMFLYGFIYLIVGVIYFFPVLYLYRFSSRMKTALFDDDQSLLTESFENLKSHYKFIAVMTIVILSLYALILLIAMIVGVSMI